MGGAELFDGKREEQVKARLKLALGDDLASDSTAESSCFDSF